jgi:hypothetical protein
VQHHTPYTCELCFAQDTAPFGELPEGWHEVRCNRDGCPGLHALCPIHEQVLSLDDVRDAPSLCVEGGGESDLGDGSCP